jgi:hypothetical protein
VRWVASITGHKLYRSDPSDVEWALTAADPRSRRSPAEPVRAVIASRSVSAGGFRRRKDGVIPHQLRALRRPPAAVVAASLCRSVLGTTVPAVGDATRPPRSPPRCTLPPAVRRSAAWEQGRVRHTHESGRRTAGWISSPTNDGRCREIRRCRPAQDKTCEHRKCQAPERFRGSVHAPRNPTGSQKITRRAQWNVDDLRRSPPGSVVAADQPHAQDHHQRTQ